MSKFKNRITVASKDEREACFPPSAPHPREQCFPSTTHPDLDVEDIP